VAVTVVPVAVLPIQAASLVLVEQALQVKAIAVVTQPRV
jgi:hypothetical protein